MKTLFIVPDLFDSEGGIARIMRLYLKAVSELGTFGDEVRYAALNDTGDTLARARSYVGERLMGLDNCQRSKWWFFCVVLWRGRSANRIFCAHLHHLILARFAAVIRPSMKYYLIAHGIEAWRPYTVFERAALRDVHRIFCVSEYTRRQMLRFAPFLDPARLTVVPNTFDPSFNAAVSASLPLLHTNHPCILVVSRLVSADPYKGVDTMIEAMPAVIRQFPTAQLRIVGGGDDRPRLEKIATDLGLGTAVCFTGVVDDVGLGREYAACDLFALPSRKEGFGLVYLEAMTYGKPCLAARAGGAPEVVNSQVGALVEYGNTDQIAMAITDLIQHPRDVNKVKSHAATFSIEAFKQRLGRALN